MEREEWLAGGWGGSVSFLDLFEGGCLIWRGSEFNLLSRLRYPIAPGCVAVAIFWAEYAQISVGDSD